MPLPPPRPPAAPISLRRGQELTANSSSKPLGPHRGGVEGEAAEEPGRVERAPVASWEGMRRSEKAKVSEEAVRRKGGGGGPMERKMG